MKELLDFHGLLKLRFMGNRLKMPPVSLNDRCRTDREEEVSVRLFRTSREVRARAGALEAGSYKGVPWAMRVSFGEIGRAKGIDFYARPPFASFLAIRMIILPILRRKLVEEGGITTLGSVFRWRGRTFFVHGRPGSGKSRAVLKALDRGAEFVADNEILVRSDGTMAGLFDELELRRATIRGTGSWRKLSARRRALLHLYAVVSALTLRRVSFNLSIRPIELGIGAVPAGLENAILVSLRPGSVIQEEKPALLVQDLLEYEKWFYQTYGFCLIRRPGEYFSRFSANAERLLSGASCWRAPIGAGLDSLLALEGGGR